VQSKECFISIAKRQIDSHETQKNIRMTFSLSYDDTDTTNHVLSMSPSLGIV